MAKKIFTDLIEDLLSKRISEYEFCNKFEEVWNFGSEREDLSNYEKDVLEDLFYVTANYSPFREEVKEYDRYIGEDELVENVRISYNKLR